MAEEDEVRALLTGSVAGLGEITPPAVSGLVHRRRRRAATRQMVAIAAVVLAVVGLAVGIRLGRGNDHRPVANQPPPPVATASSPSVSAAQLAGYRWSALPTAPIPVRSGAAAVWTGSALFVWGGAIGNNARNDGALYDPSSRRWTMLPASPLKPAAYAKAVVVDGSVVVWTGSEGARFDLRTDRWTMLPAIPASMKSELGTTAVDVVGRDVVVIRASSSMLQADVFDTSTSRWSDPTRVDLPAEHKVGGLDAISTGAAVYAWPAWSHTTNPRPNEYDTTSGVDAYSFEPATHTWSSLSVKPQAGYDAAGAIWTGSKILFPQAQRFCGPCSGPATSELQSILVDPRTGRRTSIPDGPLGSAGDTLAWTGSAMLSYDAHTVIGRTINPGNLAVWDRGSNQWTTLPNAPVPSDAIEDTIVWTGSSLILWGISSTKGVPAGSGGLIFAP